MRFVLVLALMVLAFEVVGWFGAYAYSTETWVLYGYPPPPNAPTHWVTPNVQAGLIGGGIGAGIVMSIAIICAGLRRLFR